MVNLVGDKIRLTQASEAQLDELYYWRFEEKRQEAKRWNGPYIPEARLSKEQHREKWLEEESIASGVPASLVITADEKQSVTSAPIGWTKTPTGWKQASSFMTLITGTVDTDRRLIGYGLIFFSNSPICIGSACPPGREMTG